MLSPSDPYVFSRGLVCVEVALIILLGLRRKVSWVLGSFLLGSAIAVFTWLMLPPIQIFSPQASLGWQLLVLVGLHSILWFPCGMLGVALAMLIRKGLKRDPLFPENLFRLSNVEFRLILLMSGGGILICGPFALWWICMYLLALFTK